MRSFATFVSSIERGLNLRDASIFLFTVYFACVMSLAGCGSGGSTTGKTLLSAQIITFTQPTSPITYTSGLTVSLSATGGGSGNAVIFTVDTTSTGKGTVSGNTLTVTAAGKIVIDANQAGNSNYYAADQVSVTIVVNQATPTITTWPTASAITYGAALSTSTLTGGTASVAGIFTWTAPSTVPAVGTDSESVTFTPTDATDYLSVIGTVPVIVNPVTPQITNFTIAGGPYATEDEFSNTFLQDVFTCPSCAIGDTISMTTETIPAISGTLTVTLGATGPTYAFSTVFNGGGFDPSWTSVEIKHPGGVYGNQYSVPFLSIGSQSTLAISPTTGMAFQVEPDTGQVDTRTTDGTTGTFFPTCTSLICEQSAVQIAVDDTTGNVAYLHTGKNDKGSVPYVSVYTPTGGTVCSFTATGMSYVSGIAAKGGYMVFTDPTENLVGKAKMDCTGYTTVPVAGQPWAASMTNGTELDAYVVSRDKASANGLPMLNKLNVLTWVVEGTVELTGFAPVSTIRATTPYEGIYQVQAFSLTSTAAVLFMSDSTDGTVLIINTNTSSGAKMSIKYAVSVPELPIAIAAQESASTATVWVNYILGTGEAVTHIGAINPTLATQNYASGIGTCATGLIGGFAADANGVHCAGGSTIAAPIVLQP
jgi:hypothetical protein